MPSSDRPNVDPNKIPASFLYNQVGRDPAEGIRGAPPGFSQPFLEHIYTVSGRYGLVSHSYLNQDEALNDSRSNAYRMRNDCGVMESLEARQRATALLNWHIEPEDARSQEQRDLAAAMTDILAKTPRFTEMRRSLLEALWYGRTLTCATFQGRLVQGRRRICVKEWQPRNADKLKFRYDDGTYKYVEGQVGIRVGTAYAKPRTWIDPNTGMTIHKIQPTEEGLVYWLDKWERNTCVVHRHMVEDGPYWEPRFAGRIYGVGIRDRIYWSWYAMVECLQRVLEYLDRAAFGIEVWPYQAANAKAKVQTEAAAKEAMAGGRTVILAPLPQGEDAQLYMPQLVEPGLGGVEQCVSMIKTYWGHKIKRYILGQTLSSEAEATGLGSGVADAHLATLADIVQYDAVNLEESITTDFLAPLQKQNFPASGHIDLKFCIDTEDPDTAGKMQSFKQAWEMGLAIKSSDVADVIGISMPDADDEVLKNPQIAAAQQAATGGGMMPQGIAQDADGDGIAGEGTPEAQIVPPGWPQPRGGDDYDVLSDYWKERGEDRMAALTKQAGGMARANPLDLGELLENRTASGEALASRMHRKILGHLNANGS